MQIFEIALKICLVVLPRQPVHTRCRVHLEFVERVLETIDADVVGERDELLLLPFPCDLRSRDQIPIAVCGTDRLRHRRRTTS
jgi:hypothetical protein